MAIPSEWAGPPVEWVGLPVSSTLPYLRVSKICLMRPGVLAVKCWGHTRPATVGARAFVLPNKAEKAPIIRFSLPQASLMSLPPLRFSLGKE